MKCLFFRRVLQEANHLKSCGMRLSGQPPSQCDVQHDLLGVKFFVRLVRMFVEGRVHTHLDVGKKVCSIEM